MKTDLVHVSKREIFTDSIVIANMLEVKHAFLLRTIEPIIERQKNKLQSGNLKFPQKFIQSTYTNKMNRTYKMYEMNKSAYMKLSMHLKGYEKAEDVQDMIIEAFCLMEEALANKQNASWLSARNNSKQIRKAETDTIKDFVRYATDQGSKSANMYYVNITKMTNKALEFLIQIEEGAPLRDLLNIMQLNYIQVLEERAALIIKKGMRDGLPYKYIYKLAKNEVYTLADSLNFDRKSLK